MQTFGVQVEATDNVVSIHSELVLYSRHQRILCKSRLNVNWLRSSYIFSLAAFFGSSKTLSGRKVLKSNITENCGMRN